MVVVVVVVFAVGQTWVGKMVSMEEMSLLLLLLPVTQLLIAILR
jgi:hypothetical protein